MNAGQTNILVNSLIAITNIKDHNDECLNGIIGEVTHPFASGCTDKGWIGIYSNVMTPYGYKFNCKESEVKILNEKEVEAFEKYKSLYGAHNVYFDISLKEDRLLIKDKNHFINQKEYGVVIAPIN